MQIIAAASIMCNDLIQAYNPLYELIVVEPLAIDIYHVVCFADSHLLQYPVEKKISTKFRFKL